MANGIDTNLGAVVSLWRYPVKSMLGEELNAAEVTMAGLRGDRAYALVDQSDGKVASAKNPRRWPRLFDFRAALAAGSEPTGNAPPVRVTLPDGTVLDSRQDNIHRILSDALKSDVMLRTPSDLAHPEAEEYWPDMEGLKHRDTVTDFDMPDRTFFDSAFVHLLTTSTLDRLRALYPQGRFEARRFRPNIIIASPDGEPDFVENAWIGQTLAIGDSVRLAITGPCPRCVMTTLPQSDLPNDPGILRTAAQHNRAFVGVYASVSRGGVIRRGDAVRRV